MPGDGSATETASHAVHGTDLGLRQVKNHTERVVRHYANEAIQPRTDQEVLRSAQLLAEYGFLLRHDILAEDILLAAASARLLDVSPQSVIISQGLITSGDYARSLGAAWGVAVIDDTLENALSLRHSWRKTVVAAHYQIDGGLFPNDVLLDAAGQRWLVLDCLARRPRDLGIIARQIARHDILVGLATPELIQKVVARELSDGLARHAVHHLRSRFSKASAATGLANWQWLALLCAPAMLVGAASVVSTDAWIATLGILTLPFLAATAVRLAALGHALLAVPELAERALPTDDALPVYTVLVPLFRETAVLPGLVRALSQLNYPIEKLDIKLILEAVDDTTRAAARRLKLGPPFSVIIVPDGTPRTKPRALNYALAFAKGRYVCIFDAEDIPDPDQLREAVAAFQSNAAQSQAEPPLANRLGCLQGRLTIDNGDASWLSRLFALEYLTLFDAFLPALAAMRLPLPLGGTSNHFPIEVLRAVGGWDAHNVTEDADLGVRLARHGYGVSVLPTRTYEEAPVTVLAWQKQRSRWMKGYLQTWFVHMRSPIRLWRELGGRGFLGFHVVIGGVVLSALVLPVFLLSLLAASLYGPIWQSPEGWIARWFYWLALTNLSVGWLAPLLLAFASIVRQRRFDLLMSWPFLPVYWLLMSWAAWRAAIQLWYAPFHWEKTEHGVSRRRTARSRRLHSRSRRRVG